MHFVICIIRVFLCRAICNVLVGWRTGEPIVTLPHVMHCVVQSKSCRDGAACRMVGWRTGEPIVLSHADAALPTTQSEPLRKRFFNILVLIKRDALLAGAGVLNTSQMEKGNTVS